MQKAREDLEGLVRDCIDYIQKTARSSAAEGVVETLRKAASTAGGQVPGDFPGMEEAVKIADEARKERLEAKLKVDVAERLAEAEHDFLQSSDEETPTTGAGAEGGAVESSDEDLPTLNEIYAQVAASRRAGLP